MSNCLVSLVIFSEEFVLLIVLCLISTKNLGHDHVHLILCSSFSFALILKSPFLGKINGCAQIAMPPALCINSIDCFIDKVSVKLS